MDQDSYRPRERSRSRRRSRSPRHSRRRSYSPRSRSRSRDGYRRSDRRSRSPQGNGPAPGGYNSYGSSRGGRGPSNYEDRSAQKEQMMQTVKDSSQQDRRVYVGNLSYDVKWHHLKDFMRQAGEVLFADVLLLPNGMSKGCGIVEYQSRDQAQNAINTLSNQNLMGRLVYVREDRETEPRFTGPTGGGRGDFGGGGGFGGRGGYGGGGFGGPPGGAMGGGGRQIYVSNLPYTVGWQDLKDLFRQAAVQGNVIRADVHMGPDGRPKGSGIVAFESPEDAQNAIQQFNGFDWQGRALEVREDRFPQQAMGGPRGGFGGGFGGRGGFGGGFGRGGFGGRGGFQQGGYGGGGFGGGRGGYGGGAGYGGGGAGFGGGPGAGAGAGYGGGRDAAPAAPNAFTDYAGPNGDRSEIIFVRNLPWSTSNEDLIELFQTIGKVEQAEIQYEPNGRSRGTGVVRFDNDSNAASAIEKFTNYQYGGRPLGLSYVRYMDGSGVGEPKQEGMDSGMTQEGMM